MNKRIGGVALREQKRSFVGALAVAFAATLLLPGVPAIAYAEESDAELVSAATKSDIDSEQDDSSASEAPTQEESLVSHEETLPEGDVHPALDQDALQPNTEPAADTSDAQTADEEQQAEQAETAIEDADVAEDHAQEESLAAEGNEGEAPLDDGEYVIGSKLADTKVVDVRHASTKPGANVQIYDSNKTNAQHWRTVYVPEQGCYQIVNTDSGLALAAATGEAKNGTNVQVSEANTTLPEQLWLLVGNENNGYEVVSLAASTLCLDVAEAKTSNETNVRLWKRNNTAAQRFWFFRRDMNPASEAVLEDGCYEIGNGSFAADVTSGSRASGANVQLYASNGSSAQKWYLTYDKGFYTVINPVSGKALEAKGAGEVPGTNVQISKATGSDAQLWRIDKTEKGGYTLTNKANGLVLDITNGKMANKSNIQLYRANGTAAQGFVFKRTSMLSDGFVNIYSALSSSLVFDVKGGSANSGASVQLYKPNGTFAQKWQIKGFGNEAYEIRNIGSGLWLAVEKGKLAQSSNRTKWTALVGAEGVALAMADNKVIDVPSAKAKSGKVLQTYPSNGTLAQAIITKATALFADGNYLVRSSLGKMLDIKGASFDAGANVQAYKNNGNAAQRFKFVRNGDGSYTILNDLSLLAVDVKGGSTAEGANVQQRTFNNTAAQHWKVGWDDGGFIFTNVKSGKVLSVERNSTSNGANVVQAARVAGAKGQLWNLKSAEVMVSNDIELNNIVNNLIKSHGWKGMNGLKSAYYYVASFPYIFDSHPSGDWKSWSVPRAKSMHYRHGGNCYSYASLLAWIARGLGYNAKTVAGSVLLSWGWAAHGWTEISTDKGSRYIDPNLYHDYGNERFFWFAMSDAPVYYRW